MWIYAYIREIQILKYTWLLASATVHGWILFVGWYLMGLPDYVKSPRHCPRKEAIQPSWLIDCSRFQCPPRRRPMPDADGSYFLKTKTYRLSHIQKRRRIKCRGGEPVIDDGERLSALSLTYEGIDIKNGRADT